jgi:sRNA-binding carbon storage regulator CsrA
MLVLSRKEGEEVVLILPDGRRIVVCLVEKYHWGARLGFDAPDDVVVMRRELLPEEEDGARSS